MKRSQGVLKDVFGYDQFRPMQEEIIQSLLNRQDCLVIMPTGGGKSLCYQIPAILFPGLTLVISPLISLMQDQVQQLQAQGVAAEVLNSSLTAKEYRRVLSRIYNNELVLLYMAPETLMKENILEVLNQVPVDCITIDEAHCISEWGHDFRPEYRSIAQVRQRFPKAVCIALTATATERVQGDIQKNLNLEDHKIFISSFDRKNLFLQVEERQKGNNQLLSFIGDFPQLSGIIYCFSRKRVDELTAQLQGLGFSALAYHAGLADKQRQENQELFIRDEVQIMVATIAFGMGINKPNVRYVIHHDLPKNLESYYQQIGRAGRDGLDAHCLLLYKDGDRSKIRYFIDQIQDPQQQRAAYDHLEHMMDFAEAPHCRRIPLLSYFGEHFEQDNCGMCDNCQGKKRLQQDITVEAQKFLSCIVRTGELFGVNHIIDVLRGAKNEKVLSKEHHKLSTYGIGKDLSKKQWVLLSRQFLRQGLITADEKYGSLLLSGNTGALFRGEMKVMGYLMQDKLKTNTSKAKDYGDIDYSREIFERLRQGRRELAMAESVPPYVIFSDKTLVEMASKKPRSRVDLLAISGVGLKKLEKYGETFLKLIHGEAYDPSSLIKKTEEEKRSRNQIIAEEFNQGAAPGELMEKYNLKMTRLVGYFEGYIQEGGTMDKQRIRDLLGLEEEAFKAIDGFITEKGLHGLSNIPQGLPQLKVNRNQQKLLQIIYG